MHQLCNRKLLLERKKQLLLKQRTKPGTDFIKTIGISITSGGIGKKDASIKETIAKKYIACG
jgi:hypothetical protein